MFNKETHISDQELLLQTDGELSGRRTAQVRTHLASCWICRSRMAEIETTIVDFARAYHDVPGAGLPPSAGSRALLLARMAELASKSAARSSRLNGWLFWAACTGAILRHVPLRDSCWKTRASLFRRPRNRCSVASLRTGSDSRQATHTRRSPDSGRERSLLIGSRRGGWASHRAPARISSQGVRYRASSSWRIRDRLSDCFRTGRNRRHSQSLATNLQRPKLECLHQRCLEGTPAAIGLQWETRPVSGTTRCLQGLDPSVHHLRCERFACCAHQLLMDRIDRCPHALRQLLHIDIRCYRYA